MICDGGNYAIVLSHDAKSFLQRWHFIFIRKPVTEIVDSNHMQIDALFRFTFLYAVDTPVEIGGKAVFRVV